MLENVNGFTVSVEDYVVEAGGIAEFVRKEVAEDEKNGFEHLFAMRTGWNSPVMLAEIEKNGEYFVVELGQTGVVEGSTEENVRYVVDFVKPGDNNDDLWVESWELTDLNRVESLLVDLLNGKGDVDGLDGLV